MPALVVARFLVPLCLALDPVPLPRDRTRAVQAKAHDAGENPCHPDQAPWLTRVRRCLRPSSIQPWRRILDLAWLVESSGVRSSLSDLLGRLPACAVPARLPHGAG